MKKTVAMTVAVVFVLALATPAFAMTHTADYEWEGTVDMERQVGHLCNTGAEQKVTIAGDGKMERVTSVNMVAGKLTVDETNDFVTAEDATENLTVTSVIELCAPPKTEYTETDMFFERGWLEEYSDEVTLAENIHELLAWAYYEDWGPGEIYDRVLAAHTETNEDIDYEERNDFHGLGVFEEFVDLDLTSIISRDSFIDLYNEYLGMMDDHSEDDVRLWLLALMEHEREIDGLVAPAEHVYGWDEVLGTIDYPITETHEGEEWHAGEWASVTSDPEVMFVKDGYDRDFEDSVSYVEDRIAAIQAANIDNSGKAYLINELQGMSADEAADFLQWAAPGFYVDEYQKTELTDLTDQIWAVQVEANPGKSGNLYQEFEAAHGETYAGPSHTTAEELADDEWGFETDGTVHAGSSVIRGEDYVGNYFNMEQWARTSDGELKRFIDVSSPFTGAYLMEDMEVTGESMVEEAFDMTNIEPGDAIEVTWHDLF